MKLSDFLTGSVNLELAKLLIAFAEGCKVISHLVNNAGVSDIFGAHAPDFTNVHGEEVQKLDHLTNKILHDYLAAAESCAGYISEETEDVTYINDTGNYVVAMDPLDGSSNIDIAAPVGTIFSVNERLSPIGKIQLSDFLQKGANAKAAGYVTYGSSTVLVLSTGKGVNGFTLSTGDNDFYISHPNIVIPEKGKIYSINQGNISKFGDDVRGFIDYCTAVDNNDSRPYRLRYIGAMAADMHRTLLKGGIFMYPANKGEAKGKLRLLYECIPMAFIVEQAGGEAIDGKMRILEIQPSDFHERCAIFTGSKNLVQKVAEFTKG